MESNQVYLLKYFLPNILDKYLNYFFHPKDDKIEWTKEKKKLINAYTRFQKSVRYAKKTDGPDFFDSEKYPSLTRPPVEPVDHDDTFDDSHMETEEGDDTFDDSHMETEEGDDTLDVTHMEAEEENDNFEDLGDWEDPFKTPKRKKSGRPLKTGKTSPR